MLHQVREQAHLLGDLHFFYVVLEHQALSPGPGIRIQILLQVQTRVQLAGAFHSSTGNAVMPILNKNSPTLKTLVPEQRAGCSQFFCGVELLEMQTQNSCQLVRMKTRIQIPRIASAASLSFKGDLLRILGSRKRSPEPVVPLKRMQRRGKCPLQMNRLVRSDRKQCNQVTALQC